MKKFWKLIICFALIILTIGVIGKTVSYGDSDWNFIFEDMIWFPIEAGITIFVLDRIIQLRDNARDKQRYINLVSRSSIELMRLMKLKVVNYALDDIELERDAEEQFNKIKNTPNEYFTIEFFSKMRAFYNPQLKSSEEYNMYGILYECFYPLRQGLDDYISRYSFLLDDELFLVLDDLSKKIDNAGKFKFLSQPMFYDELGVDKSTADLFRRDVVAMIESIDKLDSVLTKYNETV